MCYDFGLISGPLAAGAASSAAASGAAAAGTAAATTAASAAAASSTFLGVSASTWSGISLASSLASTLIGGAGAISQGIQQKKAYEANAKTQQMQALDAKRRGSIAEGQRRQQSELMTGAANARQGGSGVVAGQDTGLDILAESAEFGAMDAKTIQANAVREAWGLTTQARNDRYMGQMAETAGYNRGGATFLSGVSNAFAPAPWWKRWAAQP